MPVSNTLSMVQLTTIWLYWCFYKDRPIATTNPLSNPKTMNACAAFYDNPFSYVWETIKMLDWQIGITIKPHSIDLRHYMQQLSITHCINNIQIWLIWTRRGSHITENKAVNQNKNKGIKHTLLHTSHQEFAFLLCFFACLPIVRHTDLQQKLSKQQNRKKLEKYRQRTGSLKIDTTTLLSCKT